MASNGQGSLTRRADARKAAAKSIGDTAVQRIKQQAQPATPTPAPGKSLDQVFSDMAKGKPFKI